LVAQKFEARILNSKQTRRKKKQERENSKQDPVASKSYRVLSFEFSSIVPQIVKPNTERQRFPFHEAVADAEFQPAIAQAIERRVILRDAERVMIRQSSTAVPMRIRFVL
jgi:hypothetical protein